MPTRRQVLMLLAGLPTVTLMACGDRDTAAIACTPIRLTDDHDCHLCGMTIVRYPGPKGQACLRDGRILTFCSVHDLLAWAWQPESAPAIASLHVHDLSRTSWESPSDEAYTDAHAAVYVVGHDQQGAMGHSPAPFSGESDARAFAERHGGHLVAFAGLDFDSLRQGSGSRGGMMHGNGHGH
jgi:copper chaperone NosL